MKVITDIAHIDRDQWRHLQAVSPVRNWFQSPEAYDFFVSVSDCMTPFVSAVYDGELCGIMVGYTVAADGLMRFFTERTIINGGPLLAADISDEALAALLNSVPKRGIYCEIRNFGDYHIWNSVFDKAGWTFRPHYDVLFDCSADWRARIHQTKSLQLRRALKDGQTWNLAQTEQDVAQWYAILDKLYRTKVHRPLFPEHFFVKAWKSKTCHLILVRDKAKTLIGGALVPATHFAAYEWYICGPAMSTYAILEWCEQNGVACLDAMGAGEPQKEYGVRDFKLQMGGELYQFGRYLKINRNLRYRLGAAYINFRS